MGTERFDDLDRALADLAAAERRAAPGASPELAARVLADAAEAMASMPLAERPAVRREEGWVAALAARLSRPRVAGGLMAACLLLGLGLGFAVGPVAGPAEGALMAADPLFGFDEAAFAAAEIF